MRNCKPTPITQSFMRQNFVSPGSRMKSAFKKLHCPSILICLLLARAVPAYSDVTVKVDSTQQWLGFMNVWQTNGTTYAFGQAWAIADLRAAYTPTNSPNG